MCGTRARSPADNVPNVEGGNGLPIGVHRLAVGASGLEAGLLDEEQGGASQQASAQAMQQAQAPAEAAVRGQQCAPPRRSSSAVQAQSGSHIGQRLHSESAGRHGAFDLEEVACRRVSEPKGWAISGKTLASGLEECTCRVCEREKRRVRNDRTHCPHTPGCVAWPCKKLHRALRNMQISDDTCKRALLCGPPLPPAVLCRRNTPRWFSLVGCSC